MRILLCSIACLVLQTTFVHTSAQIVNTESARMQSDTTGWMGGAGAAMSLTQSVQKIFCVDMAAHLQYKTTKNLWLILGDYGFLKGGGQKYVYNSFGHVRFNRKLNSWLRWEAFTQIQNNLITQIDSRFLLGTGPRFKIVSTKVLRLYAATLIMFERERERTKPAVVHRDFRNSSYVSFTITPKENLEIISTTFFQPRLNNFSDFRILNQASFKVKASKHFALSLKWDYLHDRFPAGTAPRTTYVFATGADFDF